MTGLNFGAEWQQYSVAFSGLGGGIADFDVTALMSLHIATLGDEQGDFSIWIDDPTFY